MLITVILIDANCLLLVTLEESGPDSGCIYGKKYTPLNERPSLHTTSERRFMDVETTSKH